VNSRIRQQFSVVAHSPDVAELRYGVWNPVSFTLRDDTESGSLTRLLLRLDGTASLDQIALEERVALVEVQRLVAELEDLGVIESEARNVVDFILEQIPGAGGDRVDASVKSVPIEIISEVDAASEISRQLSSILPTASITIHGRNSSVWTALENQDLSDTSDSLRYYAAHEQFEFLKQRFVVVASNFVDPIRLKRLNRVCFQQRTSWLNAAVDGPFVFVGPLTIPHRSACFECFETRVMLNLRESASYQQYKRAIVKHAVRCGEIPAQPLLQSLMSTHAAVEAINYLLTGHACTVNKALSIYLPTMEFAYHDILRVPNCAACGPQVGATSRELYFDHGATQTVASK
jgi:bacteriocin biosynthesis cyclodehydratase domain-containing protein